MRGAEQRRAGGMGPTSCTQIRRLASATLLAIAVAVIVAGPCEAEPPSAAASASGSSATAPATTVTPTAEQLIEPAELARLLSDTGGRRPEILHVGFPLLFQSGHITGSRHIGPASTPEGVEALKQTLRAIPRGQSIVLYCGCCPWVDCPNVRPALRLAQELGRSDVKVLHLPRSLQHDWIEQGLPVSKGEE